MIAKARSSKRHLTVAPETLDKVAEAVVAGVLPPAVYYDERAIEVRFVGDVLSKERPRTTATGHTYTPPKTVAYEREIRHLAKVAMDKRNLAPLRCPIVVHLTILMKPLASWTRDQAAMANLLRPSNRDIDNQMKAIYDAINGVVYYDDSQIVQVYGTKRYLTGDEVPGFTLYVTPCGLTKADAETVLKLAALKRKSK